MGGGAFWDTIVIWLTVIPILAFCLAVALTKAAFSLFGRPLGWAPAAGTVLGALMGLLLLALVAEAVLS